MSNTPSAPRFGVTAAEAIEGSSPLASLMSRLRDAERRLATVRGCLPAAWHDQVSSGTLDEQGWVLLARSPAVAAKLRQLAPRLEQALTDAGWPALPLRIRLAKTGGS
ncbi:hypothetical protein [Aquabacterium sp. J223]|uniref:hypothetical protein n=1 Tax=Aquabacterium sp. J223 TaxID=2898431 RepID=UPI0021ADA18D|nr:hypothetical protein [Aquabacterium sp. J223]UUX96837.1 hypothetical protein LRS07_06045 [Aquabacterium sp. J223]